MSWTLDPPMERIPMPTAALTAMDAVSTTSTIREPVTTNIIDPTSQSRRIKRNPPPSAMGTTMIK